MIPLCIFPLTIVCHSPRIRGDDPALSEVSRKLAPILPVFAGMIPLLAGLVSVPVDSPRIRGDDPFEIYFRACEAEFSPYSRG